MSDFIFKLANLFAALELKNVVFAEINKHTVYSDDGRVEEKTHDLGMALSAVQSFLNSGNHQHNHLTFSALGEEQGLHLMVMAQYSQKHPSNLAPFEIKITGIPSEVMLKENETQDQYWLRMARLSVGESNLNKEMAAVLDHYLSEAKKVFDVEKPEKGEVSVGW